MFIPLRVFSHYSLLDSFFNENDAVNYCLNAKINAFGFANYNNLFGSLKWSEKLSKNKIKPIVGSAITLNSGGSIHIYCKNLNGYKELSNLISNFYLIYNSKISVNDIVLKNCLIIADCSISAEEIKILSQNNEVFLGLTNQLRFHFKEDMIFSLHNQLQLPIIAAPRIFYAKFEDQKFANTLMCIKNNTFLGDENSDKIFEDEWLDEQSEYEKQFQNVPFAVENTEIFATKCNFFLKSCKPVMPKINKNVNCEEFFKEILYKKLNEYCAQKNKDYETYKNRLDFECEIILKMQFHEYFLIVSDIIQWCKKNDIPVGPGRGSAASSLAVFFLNITTLDPLEYNLMFERFLNPARISLPDIDSDFCQERRQEVINYIQQVYGKDNVALIMTFGTMQYRSTIKDVGRVLKMPASQTDRICKQLPPPFRGVNPTLKELKEKNILDEFINHETRELFEIALKIEGIPRHVSTHAAGVIISADKISDILPLFKEPHLTLPTAQGSLKETEALGLVKFDILGLTILSVMKKTQNLLKRRNIDVNLETINLQEKEVYQMLGKGLIKGVFQLDTNGFKNLMIEMQPQVLDDIIAAGALYRPGPMDDIPQFLKYKHGKEKEEYLYQELEPILKETYGIIVYQEQILQIAKTLAGYSLKDADLLRRAMGKKIKEEMEVHEKQFITGVLNNVGNEKNAKILFDNVNRFATYAFPKAHSAAYAIISYQSAYLKFFYTKEFFCATLFYEEDLEKVEKIIYECEREFKILIKAPCINTSSENFDIINNEIYFGISKIKGVGEIASKIIEQREKHGKYTSIDDFINRINPNKRVIEHLIYSGAFDCISKNRGQLIHDSKNTNTNNFMLFEEEVENFSTIELMLKEYEAINKTFTKFNYNLKKYEIKNTIAEIEKAGKVLAVGIKTILSKNFDGKPICEYLFIDAECSHKLNAPFSTAENEFVILTVEKHNGRYFVQKIEKLQNFLNSKFPKIFLKDSSILKMQLKPGNTSLFINNNYQKDIEITLEIIEKFNL